MLPDRSPCLNVAECRLAAGLVVASRRRCPHHVRCPVADCLGYLRRLLSAVPPVPLPQLRAAQPVAPVLRGWLRLLVLLGWRSPGSWLQPALQ